MTFLDTWNLLLFTWIFIIKYGCSQCLKGLIGHSVISSFLFMLIQHIRIFVINSSSQHLEGLIDHRTIGPFLIVIVRYTNSLVRYNSSQHLAYFWISILKAFLFSNMVLFHIIFNPYISQSKSRRNCVCYGLSWFKNSVVPG